MQTVRHVIYPAPRLSCTAIHNAMTYIIPKLKIYLDIFVEIKDTSLHTRRDVSSACKFTCKYIYVYILEATLVYKHTRYTAKYRHPPPQCRIIRFVALVILYLNLSYILY